MELLGPLALSTLIVDYNYSLHGLEPDSDEYRQHQQLSEVHSAKRIFSLCEANKGFYVKAGQFVVALRQVPKEYSWTLSSLQDQFGLTFHACAVSCDFNTITAVLVKNLGQGLSDLFLSFDEEPIAAASIAHIHRAMLKDHEEVAIKVQYPGLEKQIKIGASVTAMSFPASSVSWFDWMVSEFEKRMSLEFGFDEESGIDNASCSGHKVSKALVEVFAEMILVHGDTHPGNMLVSPKGHHGFSLVLLDHDVYKELDEEFRLDYCQMWKALIVQDSKKIESLGERFGVGKYSRYFPVIFTGRTINRSSSEVCPL